MSDLKIPRYDWPKNPFYWTEGRVLKASIPFTWNLPEVKALVRRGSLAHDHFIFGGPATDLMPKFFDGLKNVEIGHEQPGILQRINPSATRTTLGCVRKCGFCGIGKGLIEPGPMIELKDWPNLPILIDNNLLAVSWHHFDKVIARLRDHGWADFNQGIDARLLTERHAHSIASIGKPIVRLALDNVSVQPLWEKAFGFLREAKIALDRIRSYVLIGFDSSPEDAWARCKWVEKHGVKPIPMWFHSLDALELNAVSEKQAKLGWDDYERRRIMQWFFFHKKAVKPTI